MTDHQKETIWITIPDENNPVPEKLTKDELQTDKVKNKAFWGAGFVALVVFTIILVVPGEFAGLMQAQLFDGTFQVVPDFEEQDGTLFGKQDGTSDGEATVESATLGDTGSENVVEAESEAVSIQIDPVSDTTDGTNATSADTIGVDTQVPPSTTGDGGSNGTETADVVTEPIMDAETITVETVDGAEAGGETTPDVTTDTTIPDVVEDTDTNAALLQALSQQLDDFKEKQKQSDQQIQDLMQLLEDQAAGVHSAAGSNMAQASDLGAEASAQIGNGGASGTIGNTAGIEANAGAYRYNTHTVTVSPYDVLAQNKGVQTQQASYQANVTSAGVAAYSNQSYNTVLSGVQGQPDTGPTETILFAFALASFGVLVWGASRAIRV